MSKKKTVLVYNLLECKGLDIYDNHEIKYLDRNAIKTV